MSVFEVQGGNKLSGEIIPQGAKNEALQVICATLLTSETVTIKNIPNIRDVNKLIELLKDLGVKIVKIDDNTSEFTAKDIDIEYLHSEKF